ncbi:MAG: hypothetical protein ACT6FG_05635 [Methanosarcinaceae archaeon]
MKEHTYIARRIGGTTVLTVPNDCNRKQYTRKVWKDGKIVFSQVEEV